MRLGQMFTDEVIDFEGIEPGDVLGMEVEPATASRKVPE
jgi:hypothetical protein